MIYVDSTFFLVMLGWSIFAPAVFLIAGYYARGVEENDGSERA